ncbi:MAG: Do family serine endopeptidase [Bacteroidales bacterium]|nr:Do family serine endopeptidase [Bacteroidales bacterium]
MKDNMNIKTMAIMLALGMAGGIAGYALTGSITNKTNHNDAQAISQDSGAHAQFASNMPTYFTSATPTEFTSAAEKCIDGVVHVKTMYQQQGSSQQEYADLFHYFFGIPDQQIQSQPQQASGSGVIISKDGYIVTNNHVIENSTSIEVVLNDRRSYEATLIGRDPQTDIALLKIEADSLTAIPFGNSDNLKVGEWVMAIGNPFNLTSTVTSGIVSAKARNLNILERKGAIESFIQTDAAVNPGNSGGALVNTDGQLVGINTAIFSQTGNFAGYAFAVPVSIVQKVIADLMEFGTVQRAMLGIMVSDVTPEVAKENKLAKINGVYVNEVSELSAAADAGIQKGDVILSINDKPTNSIAQLQEAVSQFRPGNTATVKYSRNGEVSTTQVTFKNPENNTSVTTRKAMDLLGATFESLSEEDLDELGLRYGVQVTDLESGKMMSAGIRKGLIITQINNTAIKTVDDIEKVIENTKGGVYIEGMYPNGRPAYYAFGMK